MRSTALAAAFLASTAAIAAAPPNTPIPNPPIYVTGHNWAPFISPMGEPYRARTADDDTLADWFKRADLNHDGSLTIDEMQGDAMRFFATIDDNHDGMIDPDELVHYEWEVAPDIQAMARTRRAPGQPAPAAQPASSNEDRALRRRLREREDASLLGIGDALQGGARYGLLDMPEPVAAADTDFDRAITRDEFRQAAIARFQLLDSGHQGRLTLAQLQALRPALTAADSRRAKVDEKAADKRLGNPLPPGN
jgi:Ca2+-binding EF-hand superfamily protein